MDNAQGIEVGTTSASGLRAIAVALLGAAVIGLALIPLLAHPAQTQVSTERVSTPGGGVQEDGESNTASISSDGVCVAFASMATNLVSGDTNSASDVFVKDRQTGTVVRVSIANDGTQANAGSRSPAISGNGQRVAFVSEATNLVSGDSNGSADVFLRDLAAGTTTRVSLPADGGEADGESYSVAISNDGRYVAFASRATNLVSGDGNGEADVFVRDLSTGTLERISRGPAGEDANGASESPALSADGRYVAFASTASNLLLTTNGNDTNQAWDVFVRDRSTGTTVRASVSSAGVEGDGHSYAPAISADGSMVAFASTAATLVEGDTNGHPDIFLRHLVGGTTTRVNVGPAGEWNGDCFHPSISGDGYRLAFDSLATNVDADSAGGKTGVFLCNLSTGAISRCSISTAGTSADEGAGRPALSMDGRWLAFTSSATNLAPENGTNTESVFVRGPLP